MPTRWLDHIKTIIITVTVLVAFAARPLDWHHFESSESTRLIVAACILLFMYLLMIFELVNKNLAALIGAVMSTAAYDCLVEPLSTRELFDWEDLDTISLLLGMMIIVSVVSGSGLFEYLAVCCYKWSNGRFWTLIIVLSLVTASLSALMDNVSTMLLMSPTLLKLSELERIDPRYLLMIMAVISNIGGCATPIGDPPNLIIVNDKLIHSLGMTFSSFTAYCAPCVLICLIVILIYLKLVYKSRKSFQLREKQTKKFATGDSISDTVAVQLETSFQADFVLKGLDNNNVIASSKGQTNAEKDSISTPETGSQLRNLENKSVVPEFSNDQTELPNKQDDVSQASRIDYLMRVNSIKSKPLLFQSLVVLAFALPLFFLQSSPSIKLSIGYVSLFAALILLVTSSSIKLPKDLLNSEEELFDVIINRIEWSTLMFFFALFIVMEVMAKLGLISFMGNAIGDLVDLIPPGQPRTIGAITIILWSSGFASALIDNVPFTTMMVKVLDSMFQQSLLDTEGKSVDTKPLVFALAFGACFGGNGTLIGASANVVTAGFASKSGHPISFNRFFKFAAPITIVTLLVANIYSVVVFVYLGL